MFTPTLCYQNTKENINSITFVINSNVIQEILLSIGIPPNIYGYSYISYALELILMDPDYIHAIMKEIYSGIADKYKTTPSRVERSMRHAIATTWNNGNTELIQKIFRNYIRSDKETPSNSIFLARLYYYITNMENER